MVQEDGRVREKTIEECFEQTEKPPIKVKCADRNKADWQHMNVRSRLAAKQISTGKERGLFAATPPIEASRMLLFETDTGNNPKVLMFNDTSRAYMYARTSSDRHVELCEEDKTEQGDWNRCGKLIKRMYGTRAAAHDWQSEVTRTMTDLGFKQGKASLCVFWHLQCKYNTSIDVFAGQKCSQNGYKEKVTINSYSLTTSWNWEQVTR